jgi:hypothetical protein
MERREERGGGRCTSRRLPPELSLTKKEPVVEDRGEGTMSLSRLPFVCPLALSSLASWKNFHVLDGDIFSRPR